MIMVTLTDEEIREHEKVNKGILDKARVESKYDLKSDKYLEGYDKAIKLFCLYSFHNDPDRVGVCIVNRALADANYKILKNIIEPSIKEGISRKYEGVLTSTHDKLLKIIESTDSILDNE